MTTDSQRSRDIARAALLRERIIGALKASTQPMTVEDLIGMSGIVELYHRSMLSHKVGNQLAGLAKQSIVTRVARGQYEFNRKRSDETAVVRAESSRPAVKVPELDVVVHKQEGRVVLRFAGLDISIRVLP